MAKKHTKKSLLEHKHGIELCKGKEQNINKTRNKKRFHLCRRVWFHWMSVKKLKKNKYKNLRVKYKFIASCYLNIIKPSKLCNKKKNEKPFISVAYSLLKERPFIYNMSKNSMSTRTIFTFSLSFCCCYCCLLSFHSVSCFLATPTSFSVIYPMGLLKLSYRRGVL